MVDQAPKNTTEVCDTPNNAAAAGSPSMSAAASEESAPVVAAAPAPAIAAAPIDPAGLNDIAPAAGSPPAADKPVAAPASVCEVPQGSQGQAVSADQLAKAVQVEKPNAGETRNYTIADGQDYNLAFNIKEAMVASEGKNVVIRFADGAVVVLEDFASHSSANTHLIVDNCETYQAPDFVKMAGLADQLATIAPAAGPAAGPQANTAPGNTGAAFTPYAGGNLPNLGAPLGPLAATSLKYSTIDGLTPEPSTGITPDNKPGGLSITSPLNVVDETGGGGTGGDFTTPRVVSGSMTVDYGADGAGSIRIVEGPTGLTHHGEAVTIIISADGLTATGTTASGDEIFTFTLNPATGTYTFTENSSLDHPVAGNPNDLLDLPFVIRVTDSDGDSVDGTAVIRVLDDGPVALENGSTTATVDESNGLSVTASGDVHFSYGGDGAGHIELTSGPSGLTSGGLAVTLVNNGTSIIGSLPNGDQVFSLTLSADGHWNYSQSLPLDHGDSTNPDEALNLGFNVRVTDYDGDSVDLPITVTVNDDAPVLDGTACGCVDETGGFDTVSGKLPYGFGADGAGSISIASTPTGLTAHGVAVIVTISDDGLTATGKAEDLTVFTLTLDPTTRQFTFTQTGALDHPITTNPDDLIELGFTYKVTDADGDSATGKINIGVNDDGPTAGHVSITDAGGTHTVFTGELTHAYGADGAGHISLTTSPSGLISNGQPVTTSISADGSTITGTAAGAVVFTLTINPTTGAYQYTQTGDLDGNPQFAFNYKVVDGDGDTATGSISVTTLDGHPCACDTATRVDETGGFDKVTGTLPFTFGSDGAGHVSLTTGPSGLTHHGVAVTLSLNADGTTYTGKAGDVTVFTLSVNATTGAYTFTQLASLDHPNASDANDAINLAFGFKVTDADGDSTNAKLTVAVYDDGPTLTTITGDSRVDETGGFDSISGKFGASFGADGAGSISVTGVPSGLTHHGAAVIVTTNGDTVTGATADGIKVFTLTLNSTTGAYTFTQLASLDHPNPNDANDTLSLAFKVAVTDADGDKVDGALTIVVADDGPTAGTVSLTDVGGTHTVFTGELTHTYGADGAGHISLTTAPTTLTSNGQHVTTTISADGTTITGTAAGAVVFTLTVNPTTGAYQYSQTGNLDGNPSFGFGYKVVDGDGDTATGSISVATRDGHPCACNVSTCVDETGGFDTVSGNLKFTFGPDGAGHVSLTTGPSGLTHHGVAVTLSLNADGTSYTGKAGDVTVFTLSVNATTGAYTFTQLASLDHPVKTNPDDTLDLNFGFKVTDADGDPANAVLKVTVYDDGPCTACTRGVTVDETGGFDVATGKINSSFGADGAGYIALTGAPSGLTHHGAAVSVTISGNTATGTTADGLKVFTLTVNGSTGAYTFTQLASLDHPNTANHNEPINLGFNFSVTDGDGDKACGSLCVTVLDDGPTATAVSFGVDQNTLQDDGNILTPLATNVGTVGFTYGADGAGSIKLTTGPSGLYSDGHAVVVSLVGDMFTGKLESGQTVFTLSVNTVTGEYTYKQFAEIDTPSADNKTALQFGYQVTDGDGDKAVSAITVNVTGDVADPHCPPHICVDVCESTQISVEQIQFNHQFTETRAWHGFPAESKPVDTINIGMSSDDLTIGHNYTLPAGMVGTPMHEVTITYEGEGAGYSNTLGWFIVGADGSIGDVKIAMLNSDTMAKGTEISLGLVPAGSEVEFFLIPNGAQLNNLAGLTGGEYQFWTGGAPGTAGAHLTTVSDNGADIQLYYVTGSTAKLIETAQKELVFATHENLNGDGLDHVITGVEASHPGEVWIGFEDLRITTSDHDYNDTVFRVSVGPACGTVVHEVVSHDIVAQVCDPDSTHLSAATVTLHGYTGDQLAFGSGYSVTDGHVYHGTVDTGVHVSVATDGSLTFTGSATTGEYRDILSSLELHTTGNTSECRTIDFQVTDDTGLKSEIDSITLGPDHSSATTYANICPAEEPGICGVVEAHTSSASEVYVFRSVTETSETISSFSKGDKLDIHQILEGHTGSIDNLSSFVSVSADTHGNTVVKIDETGTGSHFTEVATLQGVTGVTLDSMIHDGSLDVGRFLNG